MNSANIQSGDCNTWGNAVESMIASFANGPGTKVNPNDMRNNCVSVATSRLLGYANVHELWQDAYGQDMPDQPLTMRQFAMLVLAAGWYVRWQQFQPTWGVSAYNVMLTNMQFSNVGGYTTPFVVLYRRADGSGHAVNATITPRGGGSAEIILLSDWQADKRGHPVIGDLEGAVDIVAVTVDKPQNGKIWQAYIDRVSR